MRLMVLLMRCRRSRSASRLSRKMLFNTWPAICAIEGYSSASTRTAVDAASWRTPTTSTRSAPRCSAELIGAENLVHVKILPHVDEAPHTFVKPRGVDGERGGVDRPRRGAAQDGERVGAIRWKHLGDRLEPAHLIGRARAATGQDQPHLGFVRNIRHGAAAWDPCRRRRADRLRSFISGIVAPLL